MTTTAPTSTPAATLAPATPARPDRLVLAGRALTTLLAAFLLVDAVGKLLRLDPSVEGTTDLGFSSAAVVPIGVVLLVGVVLAVVPRTAVVGTVYLTAYLGGAVAAHVRAGSDAGTVAFSVLFGVALCVALVLRAPAVRRVAIAGTTRGD